MIYFMVKKMFHASKNIKGVRRVGTEAGDAATRRRLQLYGNDDTVPKTPVYSAAKWPYLVVESAIFYIPGFERGAHLPAVDHTITIKVKVIGFEHTIAIVVFGIPELLLPKLLCRFQHHINNCGCLGTLGTRH